METTNHSISEVRSEIGLEKPWKAVGDMHKVFGHPYATTPTPMSPELAVSRAGYKIEEIVEFMYATANNDLDLFNKLVSHLIGSVYTAKEKILTKGEPVEDVLIGQIDALGDEVYFGMGDFNAIGVNPEPFFNIIQNANMAKLWPDGKPRYDASNGNKIMKPDGWVAPEPLLKEELQRQIDKAEK